MSVTSLTLRYLAFAAIATLANLGAQRFVLHGPFPGAALYHAMIVGTAAGLVVKYLLDKRWIFHDRNTGLAAHCRRFTLYTAMGLVTTLLFWAVEALFWHVGGTDAMREIGAVLGLGMGYALKYLLDRRFVFPQPAVARGAA